MQTIWGNDFGNAARGIGDAYVRSQMARMQLADMANQRAYQQQMLGEQGRQFDLSFGENQRQNEAMRGKWESENAGRDLATKNQKTIADALPVWSGSRAGLPGAQNNIRFMAHDAGFGPLNTSPAEQAMNGVIRGAMASQAAGSPESALKLLHGQIYRPGEQSVAWDGSRESSTMPFATGDGTYFPESKRMFNAYDSAPDTAKANVIKSLSDLAQEIMLDDTKLGQEYAGVASGEADKFLRMKPAPTITDMGQVAQSQVTTPPQQPPQLSLPQLGSSMLPGGAGLMTGGGQPPIAPPPVAGSGPIKLQSGQTIHREPNPGMRPGDGYSQMQGGKEVFYIITPTGMEPAVPVNGELVMVPTIEPMTGTSAPAPTPVPQVAPREPMTALPRLVEEMGMIPQKQMAPMGEQIPDERGFIPKMLEGGAQIGADVLTNSILGPRAAVQSVGPLIDALLRSLAPLGYGMYGTGAQDSPAPTHDDVLKYRQGVRPPPPQFFNNQAPPQFTNRYR